MKKIILVALVSMALFSCSNNESKIKDGIKIYLDKNAKDPKSYELVEFKITDTVTAGEVAKDISDLNESNINYNVEDNTKSKIELSKFITAKEKYNTNELDIDIKKYEDKIQLNLEDIKSIQDENIKLQKFLTSKEVIGFMVNHKYRLKNGFGALDLSENVILFDKDFNVKSFDAYQRDKFALFRELYLLK